MRIGFGGIALVAAVAALGGCGGGSGDTTDQARTLGTSTCEVYGFEGALSGLGAGIAATGREFEASAHRRKSAPSREGGTEPVRAGRSERQILRAMKENVALIRGRLSKLEDCGGNAPSEAEGKPVQETSSPPRPRARRMVLGHRLGPARVEPGNQALPASPCQGISTNGTTRVHIFSDTSHCVRVAPGERLLFVNDTGIEPQHAGAAAIRVLVGDYELWIGPHGTGLIPAPVETISAAARTECGSPAPPGQRSSSCPRFARCTHRRRPAKNSASAR